MGITYTFDNNSDVIICPKKVIPEVKDFPKVIISVFSQKFNDLLPNTGEVNQIDENACLKFYFICNVFYHKT